MNVRLRARIPHVTLVFSTLCKPTFGCAMQRLYISRGCAEVRRPHSCCPLAEPFCNVALPSTASPLRAWLSIFWLLRHDAHSMRVELFQRGDSRDAAKLPSSGGASRARRLPHRSDAPSKSHQRQSASQGPSAISAGEGARSAVIQERTNRRSAQAEEGLHGASEPIALNCVQHMACSAKRRFTQVSILHINVMSTIQRLMPDSPLSTNTRAPPGFSTRATSATYVSMRSGSLPELLEGIECNHCVYAAVSLRKQHDAPTTGCRNKPMTTSAHWQGPIVSA